MSRTIYITRTSANYKQTLGECKIYDDCGTIIFKSYSLERGWDGNKRNISSVPVGSYTTVLEFSPRFKKDLWELKNVPGRSECKFHAANFWHQLNGCIALGSSITDIDNDGYCDVTNSAATMKKFHAALSGLTRVNLIIKNK